MTDYEALAKRLDDATFGQQRSAEQDAKTDAHILANITSEATRHALAHERLLAENAALKQERDAARRALARVRLNQESHGRYTEDELESLSQTPNPQTGPTLTEVMAKADSSYRRSSAAQTPNPQTGNGEK